MKRIMRLRSYFGKATAVALGIIFMTSTSSVQAIEKESSSDTRKLLLATPITPLTGDNEGNLDVNPLKRKLKDEDETKSKYQKKVNIFEEFPDELLAKIISFSSEPLELGQLNKKFYSGLLTFLKSETQRKFRVKRPLYFQNKNIGNFGIYLHDIILKNQNKLESSKAELELNFNELQSRSNKPKLNFVDFYQEGLKLNEDGTELNEHELKLNKDRYNLIEKSKFPNLNYLDNTISPKDVIYLEINVDNLGDRYELNNQFKTLFSKFTNLEHLELITQPNSYDTCISDNIFKIIPNQKNLKKLYYSIAPDDTNEQLELFLKNHPNLEYLHLDILLQDDSNTFEHIFGPIEIGLKENIALKSLLIDGSDCCLSNLLFNIDQSPTTGEILYSIIKNHVTLEHISFIGTNIAFTEIINGIETTFLNAILDKNVIPNIKEIVLKNSPINSGDIDVIDDFVKNNKKVIFEIGGKRRKWHEHG